MFVLLSKIHMKSNTRLNEVNEVTIKYIANFAILYLNLGLLKPLQVSKMRLYNIRLDFRQLSLPDY